MSGFTIQFDGNNQIYFEHNLNEADLTEANTELAQQIKELEQKIVNTYATEQENKQKTEDLKELKENIEEQLKQEDLTFKDLLSMGEKLSDIRADIDSIKSSPKYDPTSEQCKKDIAEREAEYQKYLEKINNSVTLLLNGTCGAQIQALAKKQEVTFSNNAVEVLASIDTVIHKQDNILAKELNDLSDPKELQNQLVNLKAEFNTPLYEQAANRLLYDLLNAKKTGNEKQFNAIINQLTAYQYPLPKTWLAKGQTKFTLENVKTDEIQKTLNAVATSVRNDAKNDAKLKVDFANDVYFAWTGIQLQQAFIHKGETEKVLSQITEAQKESKKYTELLTALTKLAGNGASDDTIVWKDPPLSKDQQDLLDAIDTKKEMKLSDKTTVAQLDRIISIVRGAQQDVTANIDQLMIQVNDHSHQYDNYIQGAHKAISTIEDLLSNIINKMA